MAAAWNDALIKEVASSIADEGRAIYNDTQRKEDYSQYHALTYWTPNINIFRDPRWGRGQETYGEDPYLTARIGEAFVQGLQGDNPRYLKASACAKHYAVHSGPEKNRHSFNSDVSTYDLWDTYLPAFRTLVVDAKVSGVMCAYNAFQGQPCCGNDLLSSLFCVTNGTLRDTSLPIVELLMIFSIITNTSGRSDGSCRCRISRNRSGLRTQCLPGFGESGERWNYHRKTVGCFCKAFVHHPFPPGIV